jgi:hypothetical protein
MIRKTGTGEDPSRPRLPDRAGRRGIPALPDRAEGPQFAAVLLQGVVDAAVRRIELRAAEKPEEIIKGP